MQRLIAPPLLYMNKYKFDFRLYVLVTDVLPMSAHLATKVSLALAYVLARCLYLMQALSHPGCLFIAVFCHARSHTLSLRCQDLKTCPHADSLILSHCLSTIFALSSYNRCRKSPTVVTDSADCTAVRSLLHAGFLLDSQSDRDRVTETE